MKRRHFIQPVAALLFGAMAALPAAEHIVRPGDSPQAALDRAAPGDRLVFLPGLHQHGLGKHRAMLYVDKTIEIELKEGATLKLAPGTCKLEPDGEITTDQDAGKKLDDLEIGGRFDTARPAVQGPEAYGATIYTLVIDGVGTDGKPDTFAWGDGKIFDTPHKQVPITGDWQELSHGVKVRFGNRTGHSLRSLWFVSYDGPPRSTSAFWTDSTVALLINSSFSATTKIAGTLIFATVQVTNPPP